MISVLADTGYNLNGFYARHNEVADSYSIKNIKSLKEIILMTRTGPPEAKPGHFQINESGIQAGTNWMKPDENDAASILVMDEIGYYELNGMV